MYLSPSATTKTFRDARAQLSPLCHAPHATIILAHTHPIGILVPVDTVGMHQPGPKDPRLAQARKLFLAALQHLRTQ